MPKLFGELDVIRVDGHFMSKKILVLTVEL